MRKLKYTEEEQLVRLWDVETIKQLMCRRAYYLSNEQRREELTALWVQETDNRRTASYGSNWGYYIGMEEIEDYYVVKHEKDREAVRQTYVDALPAGTAIEAGYGCSRMHTLSTPLVRLAGDGKTARGMWYEMAEYTNGAPDGTGEAMILAGQTAVDFIKEAGGWKIWHLFQGNDIFLPPGKPMEEIPVYLKPEEDPVRVEFGNPTWAFSAHDNTFGWGDMYPPMPEPYYTYDSSNSYGPDGHPIHFGKGAWA